MKVFAIKVVNNSSNEVPSEIFALKEVGASGPSNEHVVYAFDYWFNVDSRRFTSRTFIKFQRCIETLEDYLVMLSKTPSSTDPLSVIEIMIQILSGCVTVMSIKSAIGISKSRIVCPCRYRANDLYYDSTDLVPVILGTDHKVSGSSQISVSVL